MQDQRVVGPAFFNLLFIAKYRPHGAFISSIDYGYQYVGPLGLASLNVMAFPDVNLICRMKKLF